jgi:uncharacterized membrane protein YidH (DUF202 family)
MTGPDAEVQKLLTGRPTSHGAATFPREYVPKGEAILYETRPSLMAYLSYGLAGALLSVFLGLGLWSYGPTWFGVSGQSGSGEIFELLGGLIITFGIAALIGSLLRWYSTSYALTNRRVMRKTGVFTRIVVDARLEKIQAVTLTESSRSRAVNYGNIHFALSTFAAPLSAISGLHQNGILWYAIPDPFRARAFVEETLETFSRIEATGQPVVLEEE